MCRRHISAHHAVISALETCSSASYLHWLVHCLRTAALKAAAAPPRPIDYLTVQ